jgi:hypothetical protein
MFLTSLLQGIGWSLGVLIVVYIACILGEPLGWIIDRLTKWNGLQ